MQSNLYNKTNYENLKSNCELYHYFHFMLVEVNVVWKVVETLCPKWMFSALTSCYFLIKVKDFSRDTSKISRHDTVIHTIDFNFFFSLTVYVLGFKNIINNFFCCFVSFSSLVISRQLSADKVYLILISFQESQVSKQIKNCNYFSTDQWLDCTDGFCSTTK